MEIPKVGTVANVGLNRRARRAQIAIERKAPYKAKVNRIKDNLADGAGAHRDAIHRHQTKSKLLISNKK